MHLTNTILMIRPASFQYNEETAVSNDYQKKIEGISKENIVAKAQAEFDAMVQVLRDKKIEVLVIEDSKTPEKPDAIFPNNWISTRPDGAVFLYPMKTPNRRLERSVAVLYVLKNNFSVSEIKDYSNYEKQDIALEGTGSIVFDHNAKVAYACLSPRTDKDLLEKLCTEIGYTAHIFNAVDANGKDIYHTNVVMAVGEGFVVIGLCAVTNEEEKKALLARFENDGLEVIDLSSEQLNTAFAGNMLQVKNTEDEKFLVMSQRAFNSLSENQKNQLQKHTQLLPTPIDIIEQIGGGSARCMMAEIFLAPKH